MVKKTASYKTINDSGGNRYQFFCDISGARVFTSEPIAATTPEDEIRIAWDAAKREFNRCEKCGKYICNAMYNADTFMCVDCSPWENLPNYCRHCGEKVPVQEKFCRSCGTELRYGEE